MLRRLQRKTLIPAQIIGYAATLLVGVTIVMLSVQMYADIKPVLTQQTDIFRNHAVTLSKTVSTLNTINKRGIYFTDDELSAIRNQPFVKNVARFSSSSFQATASIAFGQQTIRTDIFFESIPDEYVDVESSEWTWDSVQADDPSYNQTIPIIIPEDYLNLYNFGFAESQALPVVSQGAIEKIHFNVRLYGNGLQRTFQSHIVGFSNKINTILVPESFLCWANSTFGTAGQSNTSRLLVEFSDASDERIPSFIEHNNYNVKQDELENSKMVFFFRLAIVFVIAVALIIILLSVAFIIMSLNLIVQKNRDLFVNLYGIGYMPDQIARFYRQTVAIITLADIVVATSGAILLRAAYINALSTMFHIEGSIVPLVLTALVLAAVLILVYRHIILRTIRTTVEPHGPIKYYNPFSPENDSVGPKS
jgi:hypothetical protein